MRSFSKAICILAIAATSVVGNASTLDFTVTGAANFELTFSLPSNPVPSVAQPGVGFPISGVPVTQGPITTISLLTFASESNGGGFIIIPGTSFSGPQLYTGTETSPIFAPGHLDLTEATNNSPVSLSIAAAAVPEPSSIALILAAAARFPADCTAYSPPSLISISRRNAAASLVTAFFRPSPSYLRNFIRTRPPPISPSKTIPPISKKALEGSGVSARGPTGSPEST